MHNDQKINKRLRRHITTSKSKKKKIDNQVLLGNNA